MIFLIGMSLSSTLMYCETNTELKNIATNNDEPKTVDKVIGNSFMKSPITPGHKPKGINAATVVAVDIMIGYAISLIPFFAASTLSIPSSSIRR